MGTAPQKMVITDKMAKTLGFSDAKAFALGVKECLQGRKPIGFADDGSDLDLAGLLNSSPATQGGASATDVGTSGGNVGALAADMSGEAKEEKKEEKKEELFGEKASSPKTLIEDIKKIIEAEGVKKDVKSKGEQAIAKLEELEKALADAEGFLKENKPADIPAALEGEKKV